MKLSFHGAVRSVTGSRHMLEVSGFELLLDCGLFQGRRDEAFRKKRDLGFDPKSLSAVLLSHVHIDHSGALPVVENHKREAPGWEGLKPSIPSAGNLWKGGTSCRFSACPLRAGHRSSNSTGFRPMRIARIFWPMCVQSSQARVR